MYGYNTQGMAQVSALGSSEASALQRFKCISIMGDPNGGSTTVRSRQWPTQGGGGAQGARAPPSASS